MLVVMLLPKGLLRCALRHASGPLPVACTATWGVSATQCSDHLGKRHSVKLLPVDTSLFNNAPVPG